MAFEHDGLSDVPRAFVTAGHRAVSIDLPFHGDRIIDGHKEGIDGFCEAVVAGQDPFGPFVDDIGACIDACAQRGWVRNDRVFVTGVSRGAYCALRVAAADQRVNAVAAMQPVTDWRALREFESVRDDPAVAALAIEHWVNDLAGRPVFVAIGANDRRVSTQCCVRFVTALVEAEHRAGAERSMLDFHLDSYGNGHRGDQIWYGRAAQFLLDVAKPPENRSP